MDQEAHKFGAHTGVNHKYNTDDVLIRSVIVALVNSLNNQVYYENRISDTEIQTVRVPFYYAFSGDERFLQDYFNNWSDCVPSFIEGNYDPIPRGSLELTGVNILSANQTSRFVRGYFTREEEGQLLRYNSYLNSIPVSLQFNVKILTDSYVDSFKIQQELLRVFYKTLVFRVNFSGSVIPSQAGFPESYTNDKQFEYTYADQNRISISFDIEVETYFPIFDKKQEMFAGSRIEHTQINAGPTYSVSLPLDPNNPENAITDSTFGISASENQEGNPLDKPDESKFSGNYWE